MKNTCGTLYLVGGAASSTLERFVKLAGGASGKIVLLPHASGYPEDTSKELEAQLRALGAGDVVTIMPGTSDMPPAGTTGVFMTGGDQSRLVKELPVAIVEFMKELLCRGGVVGGTSAGAAGASATMITGGMGEDWPDASSLTLGTGLGLLPGFIVDTHVHQRSRTDRLMVALARVPGVGGIGLDEDTACEISGGYATVHGPGLARFYKRATGFTGPRRADAKKANVRNVLVSIVPAGERIKL